MNDKLVLFSIQRYQKPKQLNFQLRLSQHGNSTCMVARQHHSTELLGTLPELATLVTWRVAYKQLATVVTLRVAYKQFATVVTLRVAYKQLATVVTWHLCMFTSN